MIKKVDFNLTAGILKTILQNVIDVLNRLRKTQGKKFKLDNTPYAVLLEKDRECNLSILLKSAVNIIAYCEQHKLRKPIEKSCIARLKPNAADVINFQVRISKTVFTENDLLTLQGLYPKARNAAEAAKMAFTEIEFIANNSKQNAYLSSPGGKKTALPYFGLGTLDNQSAVKFLVEPFARTMAFSLRYFNSFENIICGDNDFRFVNYYFVLDKWFDEFVESVKAQFQELKSSSDIQTEYKKLKEKCAKVNSNSRKADRIAAAAALYIIINASFSGNEKYAEKKLITFEDDLEKRILNLKYLSANVKKIQYARRDFRSTIDSFKNNSDALLILDPPYVKEKDSPCKDYRNEFTSADMVDMFELLKDAKCKVILFHSRRDWFDKTAVSYGLRKVGYYEGRNIGKENKSYCTEVYSLNIDPSVRFFDPKSHGELYDISENTEADVSIPSKKEVL